MVLPVRPEEVPKDLICAICLSVPLAPCTLRSCSHVFCENCIRESISHQNNCPICRIYCSLSDVRSLEEANALGYRIWNGIIVKCDNHESDCSWTGSISDYRSHKNSCPQQNKRARRSRSDSDQDLIDSSKEENDKLHETNGGLVETLRGYEVKHQELKVENGILKVIAVQFGNIAGKCVCEKPASNGRGGYAYDRFSVQKLAKLICQNLESRPADINASKIFDCVRSIYTNLKNGYSDNPEHYNMDVRMLLGVCLASAWFTDNQYSIIRNFANEQGWM
jgi:hypothetical protein